MRHSQVEEAVLTAVQAVLEPHLKHQHSHRYDAFTGDLQVKCQQTDSPLTATLVLRVLFDHDGREMQIPNIFMPDTMKNQGVGKATIKAVYEEAKSLGYDLYISELTNSFKTRLLNRGAKAISGTDKVQITDTTNLLS